MSLTSFGELVTGAERVLTDLAAQRTLNPRALIAAWPVFSARSIHAITAANGARPARWYAVDRLAIEVARPMPRGLPGKAAATVAADPRLTRAADLLGAAGDLLAGASRDSLGDVLFDQATVRSAQARVAGLLAAGAHLVQRAVAETGEAGDPVPSAQSQLAANVRFVEELAVSVMRQSRSTRSRADDVALVSSDGPPSSLAEVVESWAVNARHTVHTAHPAARDLQGLAGDLARFSAHSAILVDAAVAAGVLDPDQGRRARTGLAHATAGWLTISRAWAAFHTAVPATPEKVALSHSLGRALTAVTGDGPHPAPPDVVAARVDVSQALAAVRRGQDVAYDVACTQVDLPIRMAEQGSLFIPARLLAPTVTNLPIRHRQAFAAAGPSDLHELTTAVRSPRLRTNAIRSALNPQHDSRGLRP